MSSDAPPSDLRRARGADTRALILDAARDALAAEGYAATTTRAIAERAGVQLSLVHYHFRGKQQLLAAVLIQENERLLERQRALFSEPGSLADKWRAACAYLREDIRSGYVRILWELWAAGLADEELAVRWREALAGWRRLLEDVFTAWIEHLEVELPLSPRALTALVVNVFQGAEVEILAGVSEEEAPHLEALEACAVLIERAEQHDRSVLGPVFLLQSRGKPAEGRPQLGQNGAMASYIVNEHAVAHAKRLIDAHQYVLESVWNDVQPSADDENAFLELHSWDDYAAWHLGLTEGANDETKARYAFVYGDFRRVHRMGLIACQYRAAEWRHKEVELAAHELLQHLDKTRA